MQLHESFASKNELQLIKPTRFAYTYPLLLKNLLASGFGHRARAKAANHLRAFVAFMAARLNLGD